MGYSNSPMVEYTKLSPNNSGLRTHCIDRITPHCVVGQCTAEGLGEWFANSSAQSSSNYGIDRDGRVGLYVEEKNRSWCSSNADNDQRAVTIECASDTTEPYAFRDGVYQSLISLCADICRRNGKTKLLWFADKDRALSYEPAADEMVLTVHRWFANKACPGNWMYTRMGELASKVTAALMAANLEKPAMKTEKPEHDTAKAVWDFLLGKIGNAFGVAGLMGNLCAESGLKANNLENTGNDALGMSDDEFTALVDSGAYNDFVSNKYAYGLAQWGHHSRKAALLAYAQNRGTSIGDLKMQLGFLWKEINESYASMLSILKTATTIRQASDAVLIQFERPADQGNETQEQRAAFGQIYYNRFSGSAPAEKVNKDEAGDCMCSGPGAVSAATRKYTVVSGDTLWGIARKLLGSGYRYTEIVRLNGLKTSVIYAGQVLRIPQK